MAADPRSAPRLGRAAHDRISARIAIAPGQQEQGQNHDRAEKEEKLPHGASIIAAAIGASVLRLAEPRSSSHVPP